MKKLLTFTIDSSLMLYICNEDNETEIKEAGAKNVNQITLAWKCPRTVSLYRIKLQTHTLSSLITN